MECVLKDLIAISKDGEWGKGEPFNDSVEMLAVRGTDFEDVRFGNTATTPRRHIPKHIAERKQLQPWDVVIEAAGGTKNQITGRTVLLRPHLFSRSELPLTCASFSRFIRFNTELCDPEFMFWYLQYLYASGSMHAYHTQHTGVARFQWTTFSEREPLELPPLPVQERIAGILSAYDELIENSQRRIRILEAMARALYREWFVHFRFPGHEKHPRVAPPLGDTPRGWEVGKLGDVCRVIPGYAFKSSDWQSSGVSVVKIKNIQQDNTIDTENTDFVSDVVFQTTPRKFVLGNGDILIAMTGATAGKIGKLRVKGTFLLNQRVAKIFPNDVFRSLVWCAISTEESQARFFRLADGAAQPNMSGSQIEGVELICPPRAIAEAFSKLADPILKQSDELHLKIQNLRRTRDLLLPRLLSGQIAINGSAT